MEVLWWNMGHNDFNFFINNFIAMELDKGDLPGLSGNFVLLHMSSHHLKIIIEILVKINMLDGVHESSLVHSIVFLSLHAFMVSIFSILILHVDNILVSIVCNVPLSVMCLCLFCLCVEPQLDTVISVAF
ncbi:unnamed protein product [Moneuplotes crassus]|uniref:Uncharacterized protein n=1 Tax=Euplotes crassus TaxID=5936 RepID=A0AAD1XY67_EUPCR|nr:unnamed protein product [Moneuplotes crassus]